MYIRVYLWYPGLEISFLGELRYIFPTPNGVRLCGFVRGTTLPSKVLGPAPNFPVRTCSQQIYSVKQTTIT